MDQKDEPLACTVSEKGVCEPSSPPSQESLENEVMADIERKVESTVTENSISVSQIQTVVKKSKKNFPSWFSCFFFEVSDRLSEKKAELVAASVSVPAPAEETLDLTPVEAPSASEPTMQVQKKNSSRVSKASREAKIIFRSHTLSV
jgi:hypothetical protein